MSIQKVFEIIIAVALAIVLAYFLTQALCPISEQLCKDLKWAMRSLIVAIVLGAYFFLRYKVWAD